MKRAAGERLANLALKEQYAQTSLHPYSPRFNSLKIQQGKAIISITYIGKLAAKASMIKNFQLAGNELQFYPATATIDKKGKIVLIAKQVSDPLAVRYCFTNDAIPDLFDINNLPLLPFRIDKW